MSSNGLPSFRLYFFPSAFLRFLEDLLLRTLIQSNPHDQAVWRYLSKLVHVCCDVTHDETRELLWEYFEPRRLPVRTLLASEKSSASAQSGPSSSETKQTQTENGSITC